MARLCWMFGLAKLTWESFVPWQMRAGIRMILVGIKCLHNDTWSCDMYNLVYERLVSILGEIFISIGEVKVSEILLRRGLITSDLSRIKWKLLEFPWKKCWNYVNKFKMSLKRFQNCLKCLKIGKIRIRSQKFLKKLRNVVTIPKMVLKLCKN